MLGGSPRHQAVCRCLTFLHKHHASGTHLPQVLTLLALQRLAPALQVQGRSVSATEKLTAGALSGACQTGRATSDHAGSSSQPGTAQATTTLKHMQS